MKIGDDCLLFYELNDLIDPSLPIMYDARLCRRIPEKPVDNFFFTNEFTDENAEFALIGVSPSFTPWLDLTNNKMEFLPYKKS